jgi:hypothetical protein
VPQPSKVMVLLVLAVLVRLLVVRVCYSRCNRFSLQNCKLSMPRFPRFLRMLVRLPPRSPLWNRSKFSSEAL